MGRGVYLVRRGRDPHFVQVRDVILDTLGGVVGQERVADPQAGQQRQERIREREERAAAINRAVHVERHMPDLSQPLDQR